MGEKLQRGKRLQKSSSLKGQLNFDLFTKTTFALATPSGSAKASANILERSDNAPEAIQEALVLLAKDHEARLDEKFSHYRDPQTKPEVLKERKLQRQQALAVLVKLNEVNNLPLALRENAMQLSQAFVENLRNPQYFEPPENVTPIVQFYISAHPNPAYRDLASTLAYVETCYREDLNNDPGYRELKHHIKSKLLETLNS